MNDDVRTLIAPSTLYVVATPIGNLGDISRRALLILAQVDWIAAEDTRHSQRLLQHFAIETPLVALHEHNELARVPGLVAQLQAGQAGALISDAGTPLISDPGFPLVRELRRQGLAVCTVPGPSSVMAALSIAGLPCERFSFEGFLPPRRVARQRRLAELATHPQTLVFFESPHRIVAAVQDLAAILGAERPACLARELTKTFEQSHVAPLGALLDWLQAVPERQRGEFVLVVQGASVQPETAEQQRLLRLLLRELPLKRAVAVAAELSGGQRNTLYKMALALNAEHD